MNEKGFVFLGIIGMIVMGFIPFFPLISLLIVFLMIFLLFIIDYKKIGIFKASIPFLLTLFIGIGYHSLNLSYVNTCCYEKSGSYFSPDIIECKGELEKRLTGSSFFDINHIKCNEETKKVKWVIGVPLIKNVYAIS